VKWIYEQCNDEEGTRDEELEQAGPGNRWLDRVMADPDTRGRVEALEVQMEEAERSYRMNRPA